MTSGILAAIEYGSYVSIVRLAVFTVLFFVSLPVMAWIYRDAEALDYRPSLWTGVLIGGIIIGSLQWLVMPVFAWAVAVHAVVVGGICLVYVFKRNSLVSDWEKVLTIGHIAGLFSGKSKQKNETVEFHLYTANRNEVEQPQAKTPDYAGWKQTVALLREVLLRRASEAKFTPAGDVYNCVYLIDGMQAPQEDCSREQMATLTKFLKHLADLEISETRKPQKGKFTLRKDNKDTRFQLNTAGSTQGEEITLRVEEAALKRSLDELGLRDSQIKQLSSIKDHKNGLFVITGPPRTGVTTTFYTLLLQHDAFMNNIVTLEKRPAAELNQITQNTYTLSDSGTASFAQRVMGLLRRDPDIFGVDYCSDETTAKELITAAKNKRIYMTMESPSIIQAISKLLKWTGDQALLADVLIGLSCQRLLRDLCDECKEAYEPNKDLLKKFNIPADKVQLLYRSSEFKYTKRGKPVLCEKCRGMGFYGRTGLFETVIFDQPLRKAFKDAANVQEITAHLRRAKMLYLQEQAIRRVVEGTTAINEVIREFSPSKPSEAAKA